MEDTYLLALVISIFCHLTDLCFNPMEPCKESTVFIFLAMMTLHKIDAQNLNRASTDFRSKIKQVLTLCIAMQVLLVVAWFPFAIIVNFVVNMVCKGVRYFGPGEHDWMINRVEDNGASVIILVLESFALFMGFEMRDMQRFFGSKDDCLSESILSFVKKQQDRVIQRERRNHNKKHKKKRSKNKDSTAFEYL
ncbi:uncharacterized protein Dana_GF14617 [Drosophila ananassae]|uniref:Uncharacterized protein n=1 Tax=Drosophila ananassae TaxID=7217 RepID=B3MPJ6_DROAN|nr:uncharacterized protein LOC6497439 [Drosophila ananassae]EDV31292.1 uncharacterized protein Dana_GF14617 [Drosophila ananassae]